MTRSSEAIKFEGLWFLVKSGVVSMRSIRDVRVEASNEIVVVV